MSQSDMRVEAMLDWLAVTYKHTPDAAHVSGIYGLSPSDWIECKPRNGYTIARQHRLGIVEMSNPDRPDMGIHVLATGKTLAKVKAEMNLEPASILAYHMINGARVSRLDLAVDAHNSGLQPQVLANQFDAGECATTSRKGSYIRSTGDASGDTCYVGSLKSRKRLLRVYDKAGEQGYAGIDWKRIELSCGAKYAHAAAETMRTEGYSVNAIPRIIRNVAHWYNNREWCLVIGYDKIEWSAPTDTDSNTWQWLVNSVIPALAKECVRQPGRWEQFQKMALIEIERLLDEQSR